MNDDLFNFLIIRYGEIGLKSKQVRRKFENILVNRIREMLRKKNIPYEHIKLLPTRGRIFLHTPDLAGAVKELKKCFGIVSFSPAFKVSSNRNSIRDAALKLAEFNLKINDTFAIRTKRVGQHLFSSQDVSAEAGAFILKNLLERKISVDLSNPKHIINIEIRDKDTFLFNQTIYGVAGLPFGSQGKLISLISGGIDSPVASWLMMKRGCNIIPLFYDLSPYINEFAYNRLVLVLQKLFEYSPYKQITIYLVPHGIFLKQIKEIIPPKLNCIFCKRIMYQVAEKLAERLKTKAIVTGENLGQVASQTLDNLYVLNQATRLPVFRPLIGFDKSEIIKLSKTLNLYSSSIIKVPSCLAVPKYPETHSTLEQILEIEKENKFNKLINDEFQKIKEIKLKFS
ncbi:MAG: tRNA uracil 4-sulfurtransferase ThiI [Promethearchaeota archaeon]